MREILFRGKRVCDGEWVYGSLVVLANGVYSIIPKDAEQWSVSEYNMAFAVIPETVGQYTSLKDKNGTQIFEGDVVYSDECTKYIVYMDAEYRCGWYPFAQGDGCGCCEYEVESPKYCTVIGNIHDNPELLKDARDGTA